MKVQSTSLPSNGPVRFGSGASSIGRQSVVTFKSATIMHQLQKGHLEVNVGALGKDEMQSFFTKLKEQAAQVKSLKLVVRPRGLSWLAYKFSAMQDARARLENIMGCEHHRAGVTQASINVQHQQVRRHCYESLLACLANGQLEELQLGIRLTDNGYRALAAAVATSTTLKRLSFAGSHMGDARFALLKAGLMANKSMEELDVTACNVKDATAHSLAAIVKAHAQQRIGLAFDQQLRAYPDNSLPPHEARAAHQQQLRAIAKEVDDACAGLLHLELAENQISDTGAQSLCEALSLDRRLVFLSLRANQLTEFAEGEFVSLMKEHQALMRVDLRANKDPALGILKLKRPPCPQHFSLALGMVPHPGAPLNCDSPAQTEASMPFWELQVDSPGNSTSQSPHGLQRSNSIGRSSMVSWGDRHLASSQRRAPYGLPLPSFPASPRELFSPPPLQLSLPTSRCGVRRDDVSMPSSPNANMSQHPAHTIGPHASLPHDRSKADTAAGQNSPGFALSLQSVLYSSSAYSNTPASPTALNDTTPSRGASLELPASPTRRTSFEATPSRHASAAQAVGLSDGLRRHVFQSMLFKQGQLEEEELGDMGQEVVYPAKSGAVMSRSSQLFEADALLVSKEASPASRRSGRRHKRSRCRVVQGGPAVIKAESYSLQQAAQTVDFQMLSHITELLDQVQTGVAALEQSIQTTPALVMEPANILTSVPARAAQVRVPFLDRPGLPPRTAAQLDVIAGQLQRWCGLCDDVLAVD